MQIIQAAAHNSGRYSGKGAAMNVEFTDYWLVCTWELIVDGETALAGACLRSTPYLRRRQTTVRSIGAIMCRRPWTAGTIPQAQMRRVSLRGLEVKE